MSFLAPLFLLGGLAIALPVVFHLVRRSSREKLEFSSLMFLKPTLPRMTRRNRLEHIFLLLLRCLAIGLLAFRNITPPVWLMGQEWALRLHDRRGGIPYGIALAGAALWVYPSTPWFIAFAT